MKPYLILILLISAISTQSQTFNGRYFAPIKSPYNWERGRFQTQMTAPNTKASEDSGSIAFKDNVFWGRDSTGWVKLTGASSSLTTVADITARNNIPSGDRYEGMLVYVTSEQKYYSLKGGVLNANWTELSGGGSTIINGGGALIKEF